MQIPVLNVALKNKKILILFVMFAGISFGVLLLLLFLRLPLTYATFCAVGLMAPFVAVIIGDTKRLLWVTLAVCLPITVDITFNHHPLHFGGPAGYVLSFFDITLAFLYLLWITELIQDKQKAIEIFPEITIPAFVLLMFAVLSMIPSKFPNFGLYELIELVKMYLAFFYLANNLKRKDDIVFIINILIFSLAFEGLLGWAQHRYDEPFFPTALGGPPWIDSRVKGTWISYNDFAWYLTFVLPLSLSMLFSKIKPTYKLICFAALASGSASLMWTRSRASWISFAVAIVFVLLFIFPKIKSKKAVMNTFMVIICVLILVLPLYPRLFNKMYGRFTGHDGGSAQSRLPQFEVAYNIILDNPMLGTGLNSYAEIMWEYDNTDEGLATITLNPVHNIFLHITAELGILGLFVFLWLNAAIFYSGLNYILANDNLLAFIVIGLLGGILAHLAHGMVDTEAIGGKLFMFIWFFTGIIMAITRIRPDEDRPEVNKYPGKRLR